MKEIVTIIFALLFLALDLSLIVSVKRLIKAGSKIQGAAAAVCYGIFGVVAVFACGIGSEGMYQSMKKTALFSYIKIKLFVWKQSAGFILSFLYTDD